MAQQHRCRHFLEALWALASCVRLMTFLLQYSIASRPEIGSFGTGVRFCSICCLAASIFVKNQYSRWSSCS